MHPHRPLVPNRFLELLDNIKLEFESLSHEVNVSKVQRDDYERKLQTMLGELTNMQNTFHDLERKHKKLKQQYEEEIQRLKSANVNNNTENEKLSLPSIFSQHDFPFNSANSAPSPLLSGKRPIPPRSNTEPLNQPKIQKIDEEERIHSVKTPPQSSPDRMDTDVTVLSPKPRDIVINNNNNTSNNSNNIVSNRSSDLRDSTEILSISNINNNTSTQPSSPQITDQPQQNVVFTLRKPESPAGEAQDWKFGYNPNVTTDLGIELAHTFEGNSVICCVKFSNDGEFLATGCNRKAQVYKVSTGEIVHTFTDSNAKEGDLYLRSVCFSPDGKYLACGAEDKTVKLWNIEENESKVYHSFVGHSMDIYSLDYSKDGRFIVSGSGDKKVRIWDVEKKKCFFTLGNDEVGPKDGVTSVAISPDGRLVAAGSLDRIVRLWDVQSGYFLERYEGHTDSVYSVAFSPDGNSLASGSLDKTLKLWDISETRSRSKCRSTFTGHSDFVLSVAFSPDGNWLISGSKDRSVQFWDTRTAVPHMKLEGHKNSVISVAVNPVGGTFATGSGDMKAKIWKYNNAPLLDKRSGAAL